MLIIYLTSWHFHFGYYHRLFKQMLTAAVLLIVIDAFPTTGPAMNPTLATAWHVFGVGPTNQFPKDFTHYFVYWYAPMLSAVISSFLWVLYYGGTFCGVHLKFGVRVDGLRKVKVLI